ncbi:MAG: carboxymuconolactone decarboxylase family protein [Gammaproteobacteria bacterium]|jgi:4-carboxymuconolactone decarboxylase
MAGKQRSDEEKLAIARAITDQLATPEEIKDDWGVMIVNTVLPDGVWSRRGLNQRDRSLITIAALCALHRPNELELHLGRGLDNGLSRAEICEVIMHMAVYGGFPVAVEGMALAKKVFEERED